jgi:3-ketosteroid 9alpha-monooxygenase subunit A
VNHDGVGIRDIDTGTMPDRYARGWHCLGPLQRYLDGALVRVDIFGTRLAVWSDAAGCAVVTADDDTPGEGAGVPAKAWQTDVRGGLLFVWHDHENNPPQPEVRIPQIREFANDEWTDWSWNSVVIEGSNCREIIDNVADMAHFFYIHPGRLRLIPPRCVRA